MKTILKVIWGIFAVIGILSVILFINLRQKYGNFRLTVHPGYEARYDEFVDLLRTSGPFVKDTVAFEMTLIPDAARAGEIRDYFQLEKLYDADADTWTKALAIGKYVAANIPHDNQEIEPEHQGILDQAQENGVGFIAFSPLAQGLLTNRYLNGVPADSRMAQERFLKSSALTPEMHAALLKLNELAAQRGQSLAQMALAWCLKDQKVCSVIIGASRVEQIADNLKAIENTSFSPEELDAITACVL